MKLKYRMKKEWNIKSQYLIIIGVISLFLIVGSFSYALFTTKTEGKGTLNIAVGTLYPTIESSQLDKSNSIIIPKGETKTVTITLKNINAIDAKFNLYYTPVEGVSISYDVSKDTPPTKEGETLTVDSEKVYQLKLTNDTSSEQKITFGSSAGLAGKPLIFPSGKKEITGRNFIDALKGKINDSTKVYEEATEEERGEMFTFTHEAGEQQTGWSATELTDYRYIGTSPNNYVTFNNETWRIIGVFTVEDEKGKKEQRVKLIRDESIGGYSWNNIEAYGDNDWSTSSLQKVLNSGAYYNRTSGSCPSGENGATTPCDFNSNGLTVEAKNMIARTKWYLGGHNTYDKIANFYTSERGTRVFSGRPINWVGEVGLMYPSDYGYAAGGSSCLNTNLDSYNSSCAGTDWLYNSSNLQWTITPYSDYIDNAFYVHSTGNIVNCRDYYRLLVRPNIYLKTYIKTVGGDGTHENPYALDIG